MNYKNYERRIVEQYGIELSGWPLLLGGVCNPRELNTHDTAILKKALVDDQCKWKILTQEEVTARVHSNKQREANGESVYRPSRKSRAWKGPPINSEIQGDGVINKNAAA
jgi:hypothetical protein